MHIVVYMLGNLLFYIIICIQFQISHTVGNIAILYNYDFMQSTGIHVAMYVSWCCAVYSYS